MVWHGGAVAPDGDDRTRTTLSHLGSLLGGPILPLVIYLLSDDERRPGTRHHAREALNFQLTFLAVYFLGFILMFIGLGTGGLLGTSQDRRPSVPVLRWVSSCFSPRSR